MAATNLVALILGAGPRVGASVAKELMRNGYEVAVVSRSGTNNKTEQGYLSLKADLSDVEDIPAIFGRVREELQAPPSVVVWNAGARTVPPVENNIFTISHETLIRDLNVNTLGPFVAAQQALEAWKALPAGTKKTFIYTGNIMNVKVLPIAATLTLGMGKSATSFWINLADASYKNEDVRFFYADERKDDGTMGGMELDGDAHAAFFMQLAENRQEIPWHATFVKEKGYVKFDPLVSKAAALTNTR